MYEKPLPIVDPDTAPFWAAAKEHRLMVKRCAACGEHHFYPRELCSHCHSDQVDWVEVSGAGSIYSYTVARRPAGPAFKADAPYVVAVVQLDEGPRMMTNLIGCAPETVRIGARVEVIFDDVTEEITLPKFTLVDQGPKAQKR